MLRVLFAALTLPLAALAQVVQPNGTTIPDNGGASLSGFINGSANNDNLDEGIDVIAEAATEPQQFAPQCEFGGRYIAKGGSANFAIGWYNVDPARPTNSPPLYVPVDLGANLDTAAPGSDIQLLFPFRTSLPPESERELTSASIRGHAAYTGGLIGLVLVPNPNGTGATNANQYHYTEHRFSVQCTLCDNPGPWFSHLTYRSKLLANTFYLGFEDLDFTNAAGSEGVNGNDLDYEDFLFRFTGLACPGAGVPCTVGGATGSCARGVSDCDSQGQLTCVPAVSPGTLTEVCDGLDNDCDGEVDEGASCAFDEVCHRGACVKSCSGEFFFCAQTEQCHGGRCVEAACISVTCPAGEQCRAGQCVDPCDGLACPWGTECHSGRCVDPCAGITCATGKVCQSGVCVTGCTCGSCAGGLTCDTASDRCVESACNAVTCAAGTHCAAGVCVDDCQGAVCPAGEVCTAGACVAVASDGGSGGGSGTGGGGGTGGGSGAGNGTSDGGSSSGDGGSSHSVAESGCGCGTAGAPALWLLAMGAWFSRRRGARARLNSSSLTL